MKKLIKFLLIRIFKLLLTVISIITIQVAHGEGTPYPLKLHPANASSIKFIAPVVESGKSK